MKIKVINVKEAKFEPIEIKLTIESLDELNSLWHRTNLHENEVKRVSLPTAIDCFPFSDNMIGLWECLDKYARLRNK
jgi:hypothetical protein